MNVKKYNWLKLRSQMHIKLTAHAVKHSRLYLYTYFIKIISAVWEKREWESTAGISVLHKMSMKQF